MLSCDRIIGNYDWCHPNEKQIQYRIWLPKDAPFERKTMYGTVEIGSKFDRDVEDPFEMAQLIVDYQRACIYCGGLKENELRLEWLLKNETRLRVEMLKEKIKLKEEELKRLGAELFDWECKLETEQETSST